MWRLCALCVVLFVAAGCASDDGKKHWYDEAMKDLRGDNQQMRGFKSAND
jgi:hypothetical protein